MALDTTEWFTENRVIYQQYSGNVTVADMHAGHSAIMNLLNTSAIGKERIHIIIDLSRRKTLAPDTMKLSTVREIFGYTDKRFSSGWFLIVQPNPHPVMRFVTVAAAKATGFKLRMMPSLDHAHTFLKRADTSLPDSFLSDESANC